jgi:CheY-like chemotaxis protein
VKNVDAASNGQIAFDFVIRNEKLDEAITHLNSHHYYDAVFLDLDMPILNGYDACSSIKNHYKRLN